VRALERSEKGFYGLLKLSVEDGLYQRDCGIMIGKHENSRVWTLRHLWRIVPVDLLHNQNIDVSNVGEEASLSWQ
jgi:hypothetical protein